MHFNAKNIPDVIYDRRPDYVEMYWDAWRRVTAHVLDNPGLPVPRYMDEAFQSGHIWIVDTCYNAMFCKFSPKRYPGIESMDNFFLPLYDKIPIQGALIHHSDNPPLFAWAENEYIKYTGDLDRVRRDLVTKKYLLKHYDFFDTVRFGQRIPHCFMHTTLQRVPGEGYFWTGNGAAMDNTARGNDIHANIYWVDALSQQALSALHISRLAAQIGEDALSREYAAKYDDLKALLNKYYYDEQDGCYYDIYVTHMDPCRILTPASFYALLAEIATPEQARRQIDTLRDPHKLGGKIPVLSLSRDDSHFERTGRYWRGSVWAAFAYLVAKAIEKYNEFDLAAEISEKTFDHMLRVYHECIPHSLWECYSPTEHKPGTTLIPGHRCKPNYCGTTALVPITLLIENIIGIHSVDCLKNHVHYHHRKIGRHGVRRLAFGETLCDIIADDTSISVTTNKAFTLFVDGTQHACKVGTTTIPLA